MTRSIPWPRILAEGFAIVVSILLAFGIQAWWEGRQGRVEEQVALVGLEADFLVNLLELNRTLADHTDFMRAIARLQAMSDEERAELPEDSVDVFVSAMTVPATFAAQDGTLDALVASGQLDVISDPVLRELLVRWKSLVGDVSEEVTRLYDATIQVRQRIIELGPPWPFVERLGDVAPEFSEAASRYGPGDLAMMADDREVMDLALGRVWIAQTYLNEVRRMVPQAEEALKLLDTQIHPAPIVSVSVSALATDSVRVGSNGYFQAHATFSDGTTRAVGYHAAWSSSDASVIELGAYGNERAVQSGRAEVCATYRDVSDCVVMSAYHR